MGVRTPACVESSIGVAATATSRQVAGAYRPDRMSIRLANRRVLVVRWPAIG